MTQLDEVHTPSVPRIPRGRIEELAEWHERAGAGDSVRPVRDIPRTVITAPHTIRAEIARAPRGLRTERALAPDRKHGDIPL